MVLCSALHLYGLFYTIYSCNNFFFHRFELGVSLPPYKLRIIGKSSSQVETVELLLHNILPSKDLGEYFCR